MIIFCLVSQPTNAPTPIKTTSQPSYQPTNPPTNALAVVSVFDQPPFSDGIHSTWVTLFPLCFSFLPCFPPIILWFQDWPTSHLSEWTSPSALPSTMPTSLPLAAPMDIPTESLTLQPTFHPTFSQTTSIVLQTIQPSGSPSIMIRQHHNHLAN